jgi:hypothetical protein
MVRQILDSTFPLFHCRAEEMFFFLSDKAKGAVEMQNAGSPFTEG